MMALPRIEHVDGHARLLVDGRPFLILGLQWDCDSCFSPEEMNPLFAHAARMGANTAALPTYLREVEPTPGRYDFRMVDERIEQARAHGLRVVLLWFATWKNASSFYAPAYIRDDPATYPPARDRTGGAMISFCPSAETTWRRDRDALVALMTHVRDHDPAHTVIMVQIENEPGLLRTDRCYCPTCNERFAAGDWPARWGVHAAEAFTVEAVAYYIDRLAGEAKAILPLPLYTNVLLAPPVGAVPGFSHPSGGAVSEMLDHFRQHVQHLDLIAPDIYLSGHRDFDRLCRIYGTAGNPLYIAEHSSSLTGRAERNVFYAVGTHGAVGFDPWAIDAPFPGIHTRPLVDPVGGEWGPHALWLRDSYHVIGRAIAPIVAAQGSDRICTVVQEPAEDGTAWAAAGCDLLVSYHDPDQAARGLLIQQAEDQFLLIGVGFSVRFRLPSPDGRPVPVISAGWGRYDGDQWITLHPMRREHHESEGRPVSLYEPGVARVMLELSGRAGQDAVHQSSAALSSRPDEQQGRPDARERADRVGRASA